MSIPIISGTNPNVYIMITVVCYLPLSNLNQPLIQWYNPFGDTFQLQIVAVHPIYPWLVGARRRPCTLISKLSNTTPGSSQDTMRRTRMGTGIWTPRIVSYLMEAVNSLKLESSITLCKSIIKIFYYLAFILKLYHLWEEDLCSWYCLFICCLLQCLKWCNILRVSQP